MSGVFIQGLRLRAQVFAVSHGELLVGLPGIHQKVWESGPSFPNAQEQL